MTNIKFPNERMNRLKIFSLIKPIENCPTAPKKNEAKAYFNHKCCDCLCFVGDKVVGRRGSFRAVVIIRNEEMIIGLSVKKIK